MNDAPSPAELSEQEIALMKARLERALQGTDSGSDTRAGSLRGGSASGSDDDPDSEAINAYLAQEGHVMAAMDGVQAIDDATLKSQQAGDHAPED